MEATIAIIIAVISLGGQILMLFLNRKKNDADRRLVDEQAEKVEAETGSIYADVAKGSAELVKIWQDQSRELREALETALKRSEAIDGENRTMRVVVMEHERKFKNYEAQMDDLRGRILSLEMQKRQLETENEQLRGRVGELEHQVRLYQTQVLHLEKKLAEKGQRCTATDCPERHEP
jgi:chromosome segregation ATPase